MVIASMAIVIGARVLTDLSRRVAFDPVPWPVARLELATTGLYAVTI